MKFIQTCFGYVEDAHTHVYQFVERYLKLTQFYYDQILRENALTMEIWFRNYCLCTLSAFPFREEVHVDATAHVLHSFTKYRVIYKFV